MPGFSLLGSLSCSPPPIPECCSHTLMLPCLLSQKSVCRSMLRLAALGGNHWSLESEPLGPSLGDMSDLDTLPWQELSRVGGFCLSGACRALKHGCLHLPLGTPQLCPSGLCSDHWPQWSHRSQPSAQVPFQDAPFMDKTGKTNTNRPSRPRALRGLG